MENFNKLIDAARGYTRAVRSEREVKAIEKGQVVIPQLVLVVNEIEVSMRMEALNGNPDFLPGVATQRWRLNSNTNLDLDRMAGNMLRDLQNRALDLSGHAVND